MLTTIPFSGFYESIHSEQLDRAVEQLTQDDSGNQFVWHLPDGETEVPGEDVWKHVGWNQVHKAYAKLYLENFDSYFESVTGINLRLKFDDLSSPREYNFTTDRIFAKLSKEAAKRLWKAVDKTKLDNLIHKRFTSYDGFLSYYSNSLESWKEKPVTEWDHNQIGTLVECVLKQHEPDWKEWVLIEDIDSKTSNIVWDALDKEGRNIAEEIYRARQTREFQDSKQLPLVPGLEYNWHRTYSKGEQ